MSKPKTLEEIRQELQNNLTHLMNGDSFGWQSEAGHIMRQASESIVGYALREFDASIEDKTRQLKLGEAADMFIAAMKLPAVEVKK